MNFRILIIALILASISFGQDEIKRNMYYGNEAFTAGDYEKAAGYYLDAVDHSPLNFKANYNLANAYYRMNQFDKAMERMNTVVNLAPTSFDKAKAYHNIGNGHMMKQDWDGAIDAYKNALRLNPSDEETRYNLAYAQQMKQQQDQQDRQQDQNGQNNNDAGNSDEENDGESSENENQNENDNQDGNQNEEENQNQNENENQNQEGNENQPQDGNGQNYKAKLSQEQINNMLKEYYQRERELMKKLNKNKKGGYGAPRKKDW